MSALANAHAEVTGWRLWGRQVLAVLRLELGKAFSPLRSFQLLFLAFAPAFIISMHALHAKGGCRLEEETQVLGVIIQLFYVRVATFFGCLGISVLALRGEVAERTLHYPFLAPLRREVLIVGKFLSGATTAILIFGAGVLTSFALMYGHFAAGRDFVTNGPGLAHLRGYLLVTALACLGYSAVFLAMSLLFKNPVVAPVFLFLWEGANAILPVWLKRFSVTFYLKPLFPMELPLDRGFADLFTVVAEPTPPWLAVTGLLAFTVLVVGFACWRFRRFEISYSTD